MKASKTVKLNSNAEIIINVSAELTATINNADGYKVKTGSALNEAIDLVAMSGGKTITKARELLLLDPSNPFDKQHIDAGAVARMGDIKLGQSTYDKIKAAIDECLSQVNTPEIVAYKAERDAAIQQEIADHNQASARREAIYRAMNPDY